LPQLEFSDSAGNAIDAESLLSAEVNETMKLMYVRWYPLVLILELLIRLFPKRSTFHAARLQGSAVLYFSWRYDIESGCGEGDGSISGQGHACRGKATFALNGFLILKQRVEIPLIWLPLCFRELNFENPDMPALDSAFIFDTDGDGVGDSIAAWFSGNTEAADLDSFFYSWPDGKDFTEFNGTFTYKNGVLGLSEVETTLPADSGEGKLKVYATALSGATGVLNTELQDKIGPVIESVTILPGVNGDEDTLVVNFNKDIDSLFNKGDAFVLPNGNKIYVTAIEKEGDTWILLLIRVL
jgi:hypothetical protein